MTARCECGKVEIELKGAPIACTACHCSDCHEGSLRIQSLPNAKPILDSWGGTPYVVYRKDRFKYLKGKELLESIKVDSDSPRRVYASCCNTFMLVALPSPMHWVSMSRSRLQGTIPPTQMRINLKTQPGATDYPQDAPVHPSFPLKLIGKVLGARLAMLVGR